MASLTLSIRSLRERPHIAPILARWYKDDSPDYFAGRTEAGIAAEFFTGRRWTADLLESGELAASRLGASALYAGTSTAGTMLVARGWHPFETVEYHGHELTLYRKVLAA